MHFMMMMSASSLLLLLLLLSSRTYGLITFIRRKFKFRTFQLDCNYCQMQYSALNTLSIFLIYCNQILLRVLGVVVELKQVYVLSTQCFVNLHSKKITPTDFTRFQKIVSPCVFKVLVFTRAFVPYKFVLPPHCHY